MIPKTIPELKRRLTGLSARCVLLCLKQTYGVGEKAFLWDSEVYTVASALRDIPFDLLEMRGAEFGIVRFYGGPPGKGKWHDGTLLSMLCDTMLFEDATSGMSVEEKLAL